MPWLRVDDYGSDGWAAGDFLWRSRHYCSELEKGQILFFPTPPFALPQNDIEFLVSLKPADSILHKNISYRPEQDLLRGFADTANEPRVHDVMKRYATDLGPPGPDVQYGDGLINPRAALRGMGLVR